MKPHPPRVSRRSRRIFDSKEVERDGLETHHRGRAGGVHRDVVDVGCSVAVVSDTGRAAHGGRQTELDAPAPRTAGRQSGLLRHLDARRWRGRGRGRGGPPAPTTTPEGIPLSTVRRGRRPRLPLPFQPWAAELKKKRMADNNKDNPDVWCLPIGLMQYHNHGQPRQIVQTKNLMLITYESNYGLRYIYMDGRPAPEQRPDPVVVRLLARLVRGRHAGRRDHELPRRREGRLAGRQRQPVHATR